jgi:hypothetical protein
MHANSQKIAQIASQPGPALLTLVIKQHGPQKSGEHVHDEHWKEWWMAICKINKSQMNEPMGAQNQRIH